MADEIAGLFVSIEADLTGLNSAFEETRALLEGMSAEGGLLGGLNSKVAGEVAALVTGVQTALTPLPNLLQSGLRQPIESVVSGIQTYLQAQVKLLVEQLYQMARQVQSVAGQLGLPSPINEGALPGRAAGGSVIGGQPYLVGEQGPEVFVPGANGTIIPNQALGGSGLSIQGGTFHIYGVQDAESLYDQLQQVARNRG